MLQTNQSRFLFESSAVAGEALHVVEFSGVEEISRTYRFTIRLVSDDPQLDLDAMVGAPATLQLRRREGEPSPIHGVVADARQGGHDADRYAYEVTLVPRLQLLALTHQCRVFQQMRADEIVSEVLKQGGLGARDFRFALRTALPVREYCVQYRETDLDFVQRLLEHEGVYYFFEQPAEGGEVVVFTDDRGESPDIAGGRSLQYQPGSGFVTDEESRETVRELTLRRRLVTGTVILKDYNYRTPETPLLARVQGPDGMPGVYYDYGSHFKTGSEGERLAAVRSEEFEARRQLVTGDSDCPGLRAGHVFALAEHFRDDCNADYLLTRVEHAATQAPGLGYGAGADAQPNYRSRFTAIPATTQYRPARETPIPRLPGIMTARMETAGGDYAYIDDQGRYRVKLPFDLSDKGSGGASRAVRMAQPYSGPNYGIHFPNRAGTEMVIAHVDGDLDRPLGLSTVPNPSNASPSVAGNNAQCVIRTAGQNELTFDDTIGAENIFLHGTKDWTIEIANDKNQTVGHCETLGVKVDRTVTVGGNNTRHVKANESITVDANRDKSVGGNQSETVKGSKAIRVTGNHAEDIGGNMTQTVHSASAETITLAKALSIGLGYQVGVGAAMNETVGGAKMEEIGGAKIVGVAGFSKETVGLSKSVTATANIAHEATSGNFSEKAGSNFICEAGKNFSAVAKGDASLQADKKVTIKAGDDLSILGAKTSVVDARDELELSCGNASISLKKNGNIVIKGNKLTLQGSGAVVIKGSSVDVNP